MATQITPLLTLERANDDDSVATVAGELVAQLGADAIEIVEEWEAWPRTAYATPFWRKVIDEIRRTAQRDRRYAADGLGRR
jgi:hypothetical protein